MGNLYRGRVTRVSAGNIWVEIARRAPGYEFGPYPASGVGYKVGDEVVMGDVLTADDLTVVSASATSWDEPRIALIESNAVGLLSTVNGHTTTINNHTTTINTHTTNINTNATNIATNTTNITTNTNDITSLKTRATNLEGLGVSNAVGGSVNLTLTGASWPKTMSAALVPETILINDLKDVDTAGIIPGGFLQYDSAVSKYTASKPTMFLQSTDIKQGTPAVGITDTYTSTAYAIMYSIADMLITKKYSTTNLVVRVFMTFRAPTAGILVTAGIQVFPFAGGASTNYDVAKRYTDQTGNHWSLTGSCLISGVAAGRWNFRQLLKVSAGSAVIDPNDQVTFEVQEVDGPT